MKSAHEPARPPVAQRLRDAILAAAVEGVPTEDMVLRLTVGDAEMLKRDRSIPLEDISFAGGEMRFLGVKVVQGGVTVSKLGNVADVIEPPPPPPAKKKAAPRKKAAQTA